MSYLQTFRAAPVLAGLLAPVIMSACVPEHQISYRNQIEPLLRAQCYECHSLGGVGYEKSGFLVDSYEHVMKGTKFGEVVIPGSAISSSLYLLVAGKTAPSIRMPHGKTPLSEYDIKLIRTWIDQGAKNT